MKEGISLDKLRNELHALYAKRDEMIRELGDLAQENSDLRENSSYIYMEQKIQVVSSQIKRILDIFNEHLLQKKREKTTLNNKK